MNMITRRQFIIKFLRILSALSLLGGGLFLINRNGKNSVCKSNRCTDCGESSACELPLAMSWRNSKK
jgi:hypothetical protein